MFKWIVKARLFFNPPKKGDVFLGDCRHFMRDYLERILHDTRDWQGNVTAEHWHGENTYRLTVESTAMPYYILKAEVLTWIPKNPYYEWKKRSQPRRIDKARFRDLIVSGTVRKSE